MFSTVHDDDVGTCTVVEDRMTDIGQQVVATEDQPYTVPTDEMNNVAVTGFRRVHGLLRDVRLTQQVTEGPVMFPGQRVADDEDRRPARHTTKVGCIPFRKGTGGYKRIMVDC